MQLELIDQSEKTIKIGIKDADTTLITPIIESICLDIGFQIMTSKHSGLSLVL